jgi:hypothetical protein
MAEDKFELTDLDLVAYVLTPIKIIVWGELAMRYLGVPTVVDVILNK